MKVRELIKFRSDLFFDGAVQLLWVDQNPNRATEAARTFVFHGPRYHGASKETGVDEAYRLTDTATLLADLLRRISQGTSSNANPFSLAIAGYGSGKSHFAVALTHILRDSNSVVAKQVLQNVRAADSAAAEFVGDALAKIHKPALVVPLDGTGNFNLGNALSSALFRSLRELGLDDTPLRELSPRFDDAANFVRRNYGIRQSEFSSKFGAQSDEEIISELAARNEDVYSLVDEIYLHANGSHIPVEGRESAQDLISVFCDAYCAKTGPFSRLVIVFDEFGRFLEYVAERPALAGDSALQQIFQGIQDNAERAHFVGFIQYELKAYLARLGQRDAMHIQKYVTRFDVAKKYYLSSNLETIIAHLLEKSDAQMIDQALDKQASDAAALHSLMTLLLPGFGQIPVWKDRAEFDRVIVRGCWPLHPLATWFLTRQQDIVQSRSAITFVKNALDRILNHEAISHSGLLSISASRVVGGEMLTEMLAAERVHGGVTVDNLTATLSKYDAQLDQVDKDLLVAVAAAKKMRVVSAERDEYDRLLGVFAGLSSDQYEPHLSRLERDLGILAWSSELKQYELITDAATRGQYQRDLRKKIAGVSRQLVKDVFVGGRTKAWTENLFQDITTPFGQQKEIPTLEWTFAAQLANDQTVISAAQSAFSDWRQAARPDQAKGQVIFAYLDSEVDIPDLEERIRRCIKSELKKAQCTKAPIWVILLADLARRIEQYLTTLYVLEDCFEPIEKDRYSRFIPEERESALQGLRSVLKQAIQNRISVYAGLEIEPSRLVTDAGSIFEQVYPQALPFPFDGFASKSGNGGTDAAVVARALFGREVSGAWLDVQVVRLQNRVRTLLANSWGVLDQQGRVKAVAGNPAVKSLLDRLEKDHKKVPSRALAEDLEMLLRPPYGCNLASAAILLGLFVGKTTPPRAIQYQAEGIGLQEWLRVAFGAKGKFLDEDALSKTTIAFLTEDAVSRWQLFLQQWEAERTLESIVERLYDAKELRQKDPIPESLEPNFNYLRDKANAAEDELGQHTKILEECEKRLEQALKGGKVGEFLAVGDKLLKRQSEIAGAKEKWTDEQVEDVTSLLGEVRDVIVESGLGWIQSQSCNSPQQVADFRMKMERAERTLKALGLAELAQQLSRHMQAMIGSVEQRYRYKMTIDEATDLSRLPEPVASSRIREVRDTIESAERLIGILNNARTELGRASDLDKLLEDLRKKQVRLRDFVKTRQREWERLATVIPGTTGELSDLIASITPLKHQFAATADAEDLELRYASALELQPLFRQLDEISANPEALPGRLRGLFVSLPCISSDLTCDDGQTDAPFDVPWMKESLEKYISSRVAGAMSQSRIWAEGASQELTALSADELKLLRNDSLARYERMPEFLSEKDRIDVGAWLDSIRKMRATLIEKNRQRQAREWLDDFSSKVSKPESLSREMCRDLLARLDSRPDFVGASDLETISPLRRGVERRIDELDLSDLLERIASMTPENRAALFKELAAFYQEFVA